MQNENSSTRNAHLRMSLRLRHALTAGERPVGLAIALIIAFAGALFSKEATFLLLPALVTQAMLQAITEGWFLSRAILLSRSRCHHSSNDTP